MWWSLVAPHHRRGDFLQQPRQGDFRHGYAVLLRQFRHPADDDPILLGGGVVLKLGVAVLLQPLGGLSRVLGEPAPGQGAVGRHGDVVLGAELGHLPLFLPENQVVVPLYGHELGEAFLLRQSVGLGQLVGKAVGDAHIPRLARFHRVGKPL